MNNRKSTQTLTKHIRAAAHTKPAAAVTCKHHIVMITTVPTASAAAQRLQQLGYADAAGGKPWQHHCQCCGIMMESGVGGDGARPGSSSATA
jgi:hypothetical protein